MNGEFINISEARIPILDWGFLRSDATSDVVHVWKGQFFRLDEHIDRFFESTKSLRMPCSLERDDLKKILAGCVKHAGLDDAYVEMIQTRGVSKNFQRDPRKANHRFIAFAVPFGWILNPDEFENIKGSLRTYLQGGRLPGFNGQALLPQAASFCRDGFS